MARPTACYSSLAISIIPRPARRISPRTPHPRQPQLPSHQPPDWRARASHVTPAPSSPETHAPRPALAMSRRPALIGDEPPGRLLGAGNKARAVLTARIPEAQQTDPLPTNSLGCRSPIARLRPGVQKRRDAHAGRSPGSGAQISAVAVDRGPWSLSDRMERSSGAPLRHGRSLEADHARNGPVPREL
jgi:hypothetical protein